MAILRVVVRSIVSTVFINHAHIYLVLFLVLAEERLGEDVDEFGEVLKVFGHLGGQHHVDDTLPNDFVVLSVQSFNVKNSRKYLYHFYIV